MRQSELQEKARGDEIVKCACGLPMRQKNWADHWRSCTRGSSVTVSEEDEKNLLAHEEMMRKSSEDHKQWMAIPRDKRGFPVHA